MYHGNLPQQLQIAAAKLDPISRAAFGMKKSMLCVSIVTYELDFDHLYIYY